MEYQWILASASPRRRDLLNQVGLSFRVMPAAGEESISKSSPDQVVMELARRKAEEIASQLSDSPGNYVIVGADTVVVFKEQILGKPGDEQDAFRVLSMLSGQTHQVYTGVSVILLYTGKKQVHTFYEAADVTMYDISPEEIRDYIQTKEPMDKAGSYGIQGKGAVFIKKIHGDYNNVVGLPVSRLYQELKKWHPEIFKNHCTDGVLPL
ncbi:Septum formation protein Maf [uncultured Roseburia sp.]|uniref:dTTP/UTP pyrophosphatase n=1 Tax=Brotonthovivens ammoniilytica TaxID=2981725 RepID=A0ABT2TN55_9FIRM|nr:Maf family protein [Brotonthovivens ammoniilytica]MCU6763659.1 Maf family protein [Brotonthovivens ammoniilytica]SCJ29700.1 Septum formation protein Maf [uncultured Roseburia sp.]